MGQESNTTEYYSRIFLFITTLFVLSLITANVLAVKVLSLWTFIVPAGVVVFPISYIVNDVLTEVYGYSRARTAIWLGFIANAIFVAFVLIVQWLPAAPFWEHDAAYASILGQTPRILIASFVAYLVGSFVNAFIMSVVKKRTKGKFLWVRTISSTIMGEGIDTVLFVGIAFSSIFSVNELIHMMYAQWLFKTVYEIIITPVTYKIVAYVKAKDGIDVYDEGVNYQPFTV